MKLRVRYYREADVTTDSVGQLSRGGLLVRADPGASLEQYTPVKLELGAGATVIVIDAQVVQVFAGVGIAVTFTPSRALESWTVAAQSTARGDRDPEHSIVTEDVAQDEAQPVQRAAVPETASRVSTALRGSRDERTAILRENNPVLHGHVLRNPSIQLDEIVSIAKMRTVSPELLKIIADKREWATRPEIAVALVRNPKTPVGVAIRLLDHVPIQELRQLAKDQNTRSAIQSAARKRVVG